jgi:hypothetical protein
VGVAAVTSTASDAPHSLQNRALEALLVPHEEQTGNSEPPQPLQNFALSGFSVPQFGQGISESLLLEMQPVTRCTSSDEGRFFDGNNPPRQRTLGN